MLVIILLWQGAQVVYHLSACFWRLGGSLPVETCCRVGIRMSATSSGCARTKSLHGLLWLEESLIPLWASAPSVSRPGHDMLLRWPLVGPVGFPNPQKQKCQGSFPLVGNFLEYQHKEALECSLYRQVSVQTIFSIHLFFRSHLPFFFHDS